MPPLHRKRNRSMKRGQRRLRNAAESEEDRQQRLCSLMQRQAARITRSAKYKVQRHRKRFLTNECVLKEGIFTCT